MDRIKKKIWRNKVEIFSWVFLTVASIIFMYPMFISLMVSFASEESIMQNGYQVIPDQFSLESYRLLLVYYGDELLRTIALTVGTGLLQPFLSVVLTMCMAYPLSQPDFAGRNFWRIYLVITMLFSGGLIPNYILRTTVRHEGENL